MIARLPYVGYEPVEAAIRELVTYKVWIDS